MKLTASVLLLSASLLAGCATSGVGREASQVGGDVLDQKADSVANHQQGPATITSVRSKSAARTPTGLEVLTDNAGDAVMEGKGSITVSGGATNLIELDRGGFNQAGTGPSGHGAIVDLGDGQSMTFFSATATTTKRTKTVSKDGTMTEETSITSDPTSPTRAYGDAVLSPLVAYYKGLTEEKRAAFVAGVQANSEQTKAIVDKLAGPDAWAFLTSLVAPVVK